MSVIASVTIKFGAEQTVGAIVAPLLEAGWVFSNSVVCYNYFRYKYIYAMGSSEQKGAIEQWEQISSLLTAKVKRRHIASVEMVYLPGKFGNNITFFSLREVHFTFYGCQPHLQGCARYTDFTPLLEKIVCPMADAGLPILEVICKDDDY